MVVILKLKVHFIGSGMPPLSSNLCLVTLVDDLNLQTKSCEIASILL